MTLPKNATAIRYHEYGDPYEKLSLEQISLRDLAPKEALIELIASPINPADFGRVMGVYGSKAPLPATAGLEGVGRVIALGQSSSSSSNPQDAATSKFQIGDRVTLPADSGPWQTHLIANQNDLYSIPEFLSDAQAAMSWINPATAWLMLHKFTALQAGDYLIQNAATGAVGKLVIQFAKQLGLKTISLVRNLDSTPQLKALGGDHVFLDDRQAAKEMKAVLGSTKPKLALNAVGAPSASLLAYCLADNSPIVTYGGMDRTPSTLPTGRLIFNNISYHGFWVSQWYANAPREEIETTRQSIFQIIEAAKIQTEVEATYPLTQFKEALAHSQKPGKKGKVLLTPSQL